jgi:inner membrane protein
LCYASAMYLFAHAGLTLGTAVALNYVRKGRQPTPAPSLKSGSLITSLNRYTLAGLANLQRAIDLRLFLLAAVLPDFIDKPLGLFLLPGVWGGGRTYAHTLAFPLALALGGILLYSVRHRTWLLWVSFAVAVHLVLDRIWEMPRVFLWPLYGSLANIRYYLPEESMSLAEVIRGLAYPSSWVPEVIGLLLVCWFGLLAAGIKRRPGKQEAGSSASG